MKVLKHNSRSNLLKWGNRTFRIRPLHIYHSHFEMWKIHSIGAPCRSFSIASKRWRWERLLYQFFHRSCGYLWSNTLSSSSFGQYWEPLFVITWFVFAYPKRWIFLRLNYPIAFLSHWVSTFFTSWISRFLVWIPAEDWKSRFMRQMPTDAVRTSSWKALHSRSQSCKLVSLIFFTFFVQKMPRNSGRDASKSK